MISEIVIGSLSVLIGADASGLAKVTADVDKRLKALERTTSNVTNRLKTAFLAAAGPAALGLLIKQSLDAAGAAKDLADRLGSSITAVEVMGRAAENAGMSIEDMAKASDKLNQKIGEALREADGPAADAFKRLGLSAKELAGMDLDRRWEVLITKTNELGLSSAQTADMLKQLGAKSGALGTLFSDGAEGISKAREQLKAFGVILNDNDRAKAKIEAAGDALSVFGLAVRGAGNALANELAPFIILAADELTDFAKKTGGVENAVRSMVDRSIQALGFFLDLFAQIKYEFDQIDKTASKNNAAIADTIYDWATSLEKLAFGNNEATEATARWLRGEDAAGKQVKTIWNSIIMDRDELRKSLGQELPSDKLVATVVEARRRADEEAARYEAESRKKREENQQAHLNNLATKEREGLQNKLLSFRTSIANEAEALKLHHESQLKQEQEFYSKGILNKQQHEELKAKIDADFKKKTEDAVWNSITSLYATEQEVLAKQREDNLIKLKEYEDAKTMTVEAAEAARRGIEQKYADDYAALMARKYSTAAGVVDTAMGHISDVIGDQSEKGFGIMKAVAYATALVKGYEAVVGAWAAGNNTGIPGMGAVLAGITAAGVAAQIAKLAGVGSKSQGSVSSPGGGGEGSGGGGGGGGGGAGAPTGPAAPTQTMFVQGLNPSMWMSGDNVRLFAEELVKFQKDGGTILFDDR